jgi:hypothetical protein
MPEPYDLAEVLDAKIADSGHSQFRLSRRVEHADAYAVC